MNKTLLFLICFSVHTLYSQHALPIQMDTTIYKFEVISTGIVDYGSTALKNELTKKLIYGGFIDSDMKSRSLSSHSTQNRFGLDASAEIDFRNYSTKLFKLNRFGYYVRAGYFNYASVSYSKDVYNLVFNGNTSYLGDTAKFSGTQANTFSFQKIGFGFIDKKTKSNIGLNYYNISSISDAYIRSGNLIMDSSAYNLKLDMGGRFRYGNSKKFNKGWGVGFDADFRIPVRWLNENLAFFQVQLKNIGFMSVKNITEYTADTSYDFSGFKFKQFIGDSAISISNSEQLLDTLGVLKRTKNLNSLLPGFIQIGKIVDYSSKKALQSFFGVRLHTSLNYTPLVYVGADYKIYNWMRIGIQGSYGGFSNFRVGFYSQYDLGKYHIGIGSEDLIGALSKRGYGESIHFRLTRLW